MGIVREFYDWVVRQDPKREYDYVDSHTCAFAQFLKTRNPSAMCDPINYWPEGPASKVEPLPDRLNRALVVHPQTFGALARRLESLI